MRLNKIVVSRLFFYGWWRYQLSFIRYIENKINHTQIKIVTIMQYDINKTNFTFSG